MCFPLILLQVSFFCFKLLCFAPVITAFSRGCPALKALHCDRVFFDFLRGLIASIPTGQTDRLIENGQLRLTEATECIVTSDSGCVRVDVIALLGSNAVKVERVTTSLAFSHMPRGLATTRKILEGSDNDCRVVILLWNYGERCVLLYALLHAKVSEITFISFQHVS